jgi:hypothetical protein
VRSLRVEKFDANAGLPQPSDESLRPNRRKMGLFSEDPILSTAYGDHPVADDAHLDRFTAPLERQISYLKRTSQNLVIYPAVWYTQALLQSYAAAFTSLPAVRFRTISAGDTVFREGSAEGALWYYVVNTTGVEQTASLTFPVAGSLQRLGLNPDTAAIDAGGTITVTLAPYDFQAWKLIGQ